MDYYQAQHSFETDQTFHQFVCMVTQYIKGLHLTPAEVRDAVMFACVRVEMMRPPVPMQIPEAVEGWLEHQRLELVKYKYEGQPWSKRGSKCSPDPAPEPEQERYP